MTKIRRVRTGCWTCKKRRRKCDEGKPWCENCLKTGKQCEGYGIKLSFDVDDSRNSKSVKLNSKGEVVHGFRGRPRLQESLAKRDFKENILMDGKPNAQIPSKTTSSIEEEEPQQEQEQVNIDAVIQNSEQVPQENGVQSQQISSNSVLTIDELTKVDTILDSTFDQAITDDLKTDIISEFQIFQEMFPSFASDGELPTFLSEFDVITSTTTDQTKESPLSHFEENMMLKHFFKKLLPLLDAHPSTPWPQLALKYCDFEVAKSCFIALSCVHLYETKGAKEFYKTGMTHINNTMEYLIDYLKDKSGIGTIDDDGKLDVDQVIKNLKFQSLEKQGSNFFVILLLIHVHLLFSVLESGRSALLRTFFQLFGGIVKDRTFRSYMNKIEESSTLVVNLSWFDTITAVVSADCRLPFCDPVWYGDKFSAVSTSQVMGCPGEIFKCIWSLCALRKDIKNGEIDNSSVKSQFQDIKTQLMNYREYVIYESGVNMEAENISRQRCTQCWTLAVLLNLYTLVKPEEGLIINGFILEFINVYGVMDSKSPHVTQMVWPIFTIACHSKTSYQQSRTLAFIDELYKNSKMGTISSIKSIAQECWETGKTWDEILSSKEWYGSGIDFLVV